MKRSEFLELIKESKNIRAYYRNSQNEAIELSKLKLRLLLRGRLYICDEYDTVRVEADVPFDYRDEDVIRYNATTFIIKLSERREENV